VHRSRDLGALLFIDLRDREGLIQLSFGEGWTPPSVLRDSAAAGVESVVLVEGEVVARSAETRNPELATGDVEVRCTAFRTVGPAETPAIPVALGRGDKLPAEEIRLRHRILDLRRADLQRNLVLRHRLLQATRRYLSERGFLEIETPILTKPTPEGARDYLVPSRVHPGEFYALPQSPQLYKQLLMMAGYDRYFQIARCFRDEDLRADRQPEFTQIDVEASFVQRDDVVALMEGLVAALWEEGGHPVETPFPRIQYTDAMERYGTDRPDVRYGLEIEDVTAVFRAVEFSITRNAIERGERVRGIRVPGGAGWSRKQVDEIEAVAKESGAAGLLRLKRSDTGLEGPAAKFLTGESASALRLEVGDLGLYVAAGDRLANPVLDRVRQALAMRLDLVRPDALAFTWVVDFPLFDRDPASGALSPLHHPFTSPHPDDIALLDTAPERARAVAYDVVLNGVELGGGSIRISDPAIQQKVFGLLGMTPGPDLDRRFGFLLRGLSSGAPPHGGIAFGFDRITMMLAGASSLRDVIAFPKTTAARALFEDAPSPVAPEDLDELHITVSDEAVI
jgi:aspartyl-tRNA synthetase